MSRRSRRRGSVLSQDPFFSLPPSSVSSDTGIGASYQRLATRRVPKPLSLVLRSITPDATRVIPAVRVFSPQFQAPKRTKTVRPGPNTLQRLLNALQGARTSHRYSTPCEARRTRSRVLHALGIAGRRGVGLGKRRRLGRYSTARCV